MISKKYRFHSRGGIRSTYRNGNQIRGGKISLTFTPNTRNKTRFAVVVSKKVLKSAVGRNRIRRRIYEAIRPQIPNLKSPIDGIFTVYTSEIKDMDFIELSGLIKSLLKSTNYL
jgi:ribonuclease P protein component